MIRKRPPVPSRSQPASRSVGTLLAAGLAAALCAGTLHAGEGINDTLPAPPGLDVAIVAEGVPLRVTLVAENLAERGFAALRSGRVAQRQEAAPSTFTKGHNPARTTRPASECHVSDRTRVALPLVAEATRPP